MPITINPPAAVAAHRRQGEGSSPLAGFLPAKADNILYAGRPVKETLDELFTAFGTVTMPEFSGQKTTESGEFTITEGSTPVAYRKEDAAALTPLHPLYDADLIPYTNDEAGLAAGSSLADALDILSSRLVEKEQTA